MAAKKMKMDFKKVAMKTLVVGGTGAAAQVVAEAIDLQNPEIVDYVMIGAGVVLPEIVKGETTTQVGDALLAVGAYRMAEKNDLAGKLGFNSTPATSGFDNIIGRPGWQPRVINAKQTSEKKNQIVK
ncbi:exported hypothetical protein [uncultured Paludibacter sp.]|uniref:Uncharacterized protein n=1 Tax=uncultured Paludibacter sp. TaxID=497635 RepID=A0A653AAX8_9BACT|nr:exported hypothetical protein [uncultured Paludibacter sp.]